MLRGKDGLLAGPDNSLFFENEAHSKFFSFPDAPVSLPIYYRLFGFINLNAFVALFFSLPLLVSFFAF